MKRKISARLLALVHASQRIARGEWNQPVAIPLKDEIGQLARAFNQMAIQLKTSFETLESKNAELREKHRSLKRAEAKYHNIFEYALEGIFQTTPDGRFLNANPAARIIRSYTLRIAGLFPIISPNCRRSSREDFNVTFSASNSCILRSKACSRLISRTSATHARHP
ncbi:MAG: HAMP domain-containing protein [bacterium]|nr:HAMP domain-containing protein [bacterium]